MTESVQTAITSRRVDDIVERVRQSEPAKPVEQAVQLAEKFKAHGIEAYNELSVIEARLALEEVTRLQLPEQPVASVKDILVPGAAGDLPARVYNPDPERTLPIVVYLHGGGWVLGSVTAADRPCRRLCKESDCIVVSVDYRRAPETRFPGPLADCLAAVRWIAAHAGQLGADSGRLALMGDSAGGNLAAAVTQSLKGEEGVRIARQLLLYPCLYPARGTDFPSYRQHADGPLLTAGEMEWFWNHYLGEAGDGRDPGAAPLLAADFSDLPPATIVVAEADVLRDEGLAYAQKLSAAGVDVTVILFPGAPHGFWWMDAALSQARELDTLLGAELAGSL